MLVFVYFEWVRRLMQALDGGVTYGRWVALQLQVPIFAATIGAKSHSGV